MSITLSPSETRSQVLIYFGNNLNLFTYRVIIIPNLDALLLLSDFTSGSSRSVDDGSESIVFRQQLVRSHPGWRIPCFVLQCWTYTGLHLEPWYPWYHSWNYDIIVLTYDIIVLTYDIIGHDIIVLWYHTYDIITHMISYMMSWYDFIFHGYDIICVMISFPWIYDIIVLWYHRSMIS